MNLYDILGSPWACAGLVLLLWASAYGVYKFCTGEDARAAGVRYRDDNPHPNKEKKK